MAGIIKASDLKTHSPEQLPSAVHWVEVPDMAKTRESVQRQTAELVAVARREADRIRQQAAQQGLADAQRQAQEFARQELEKRLKTLIPALEKAIDDFQQTRQQWLHRWEKNAITLACAIASRILRREVSADPDIAIAVVRQGLELASGWNSVTVELHPDDLHSLSDKTNVLADNWNRAVEVQFVANPQVEKGSCRVVGTWGQIDQRWSTQLQRIAEELAE
jgi:flagellar assembly protein FliH